jgi:putative colanic acid biosynthesis UDP-glucose lipid carrier transferase
MLVIALAVKATSPGPVIFRQRRYGLNGKEFEIWKFRTMTVTEDGDQFVQATRDDPRVTPIGNFLRRTSLDELPQFINVLQGRMSIVGPRPHPVALDEQHRRLIPRYYFRHKIRPGITGLAQVRGYRGQTDTLDKMRRRIELDIEYIDSWSLYLDLKIILLTIVRGVRDQNAY